MTQFIIVIKPPSRALESGLFSRGTGSSRAREFHPHPLTEPCVKVSPHTALHTQRFVHRHNLMFDDRLVFESPGKLPGQVKPTNIRHTHFSRNPKIAAFLKAYHFVKEFGEGFDRICREQEANGANVPSFRTDEFILKITVPKVAEKVTVNVTEKMNATENVIDVSQKTSQKTSQKIIDLIKEDPYISTSKMAEIIGVDRRNIARNIKKLQEQGVVRRVGPDKGGFWEIIE